MPICLYVKKNAYERNAHFNKKRPGMIRFLINAAGGFNVVNTRVLSFNLKKPRGESETR